MKPLVWLAGVVALACAAFFVWRGSQRAAIVAVSTASTSAGPVGSVVLVDAAGQDSRSTRRGIGAPDASTASLGKHESHPTNPPEATASSRAVASRIVLAVTDERGEPLRGARVGFRLPDREGRRRADAPPVPTNRLEPENDPAAAEEGRHSAWIDLPSASFVRGEASVWASGFDFAEVEFELHAGETLHTTCVLTRLDPEIAGVVVDERGAAVAGLVLEARTGRNGKPERVASDADGAFMFPDTRRADVMTLLVRRDERVVATIASTDVGLGMRIVVSTPARLSGQLIEPRGGRVWRARVQLSGPASDAARTWFEPAIVAEDGWFAFDPAPVGVLEINVWREVEPGRWQHSIALPLTLASGENRQQDVVVPSLP